MNCLIVGTLILYLSFNLSNAINDKWKLSCDCGATKLVGDMEEYPWTAALLKKSDYKKFCGGVIISQWHILTAAQCTDGVLHHKIVVCVSDLKVCREEKNKSLQKNVLKVEKIIQHEKYDPTKSTTDISILVTLNRIVYSSNVGPICIPNLMFFETYDRRNIKGLGWDDYDRVDVIRLSIVPKFFCMFTESIELFPSQICVLPTARTVNCMDEIGSPIMGYDADIERWTLLAIVSEAPKTCIPESTITLTTDVSVFRTWILENTRGTTSGWFGQTLKEGNICMKEEKS